MKLSILIPTYNYDCTQLVNALLQQLPADAEIIVADDGSTDEHIKVENRKIGTLPQCRLWESENNLGRAGIRNRLGELAEGEWLLFMDSDAEVADTHFLQNYLSQTADYEVLCGGTATPQLCPSPKVKLRYKYETEYWKKHTAEIRQKNPYDSFTTFNFLILREDFLKIKFDESIREYGHEDTLFGQEMKRRKTKILHVNNPLIHTGLETNAEYLLKVESSLKNLSLLSPETRQNSPVSRVGDRLGRYHLKRLAGALHRCISPLEKINLNSTHPSLLLLKIYKLGYYCTL